MDKLVRVLHGGTIKKNRDETVDFVNMLEMVMIFHSFPSFAELVDRVKEKLDMPEDVVDVWFEGVIDVGSSKGPHSKALFEVGVQMEWELYRDVVIDSEIRSPLLVVSKVRKAG